jgi:hypothetical protein
MRRAAAPAPLQNWVQAPCAAMWHGGRGLGQQPSPARPPRSPARQRLRNPRTPREGGNSTRLVAGRRTATTSSTRPAGREIMPSAPTFTAVPMFWAPTGRVRISAQPQLDQARDRDASGQTDRHPGEQAPDQQPGQSLPRREQPLPHFHSAIDHDLYAGHVGALVTPVGHSSQSDRRYADRRGRRCGLQGHHRARARSNRTRKPRRDDVGPSHRGLRRTLGPCDRSRSRAHPRCKPARRGARILHSRRAGHFGLGLGDPGTPIYRLAASRRSTG